jgi:benzoate-CoA ligase family protein
MTESFNASTYLLDRQIAGGHSERIAITGAGGQLTYGQLHDLVRRVATGMRRLGVQPEHRVMLFMADSPWFVVVFLAAMRVGAVAVPVSTMMRADALVELLRDSRSRFLALTPEFTDVVSAAASSAPDLIGVFAAAGAPVAVPTPVYAFDDLAATVPDDLVDSTVADSPAFWLYTSGTTGRPKGAMHRHGSIRFVCETYATKVLGIGPDDRCLSAAKAFFAYGLGNSVLFPLSVGATAILEPTPSRPDTIVQRANEYRATLFFGGPTFFANMLRAGLAERAMPGVRLAVSAGEALPAALYQQWTSRFGLDIIDGIGMTEMLHIFLSNQPGRVRPGTTGVAVPGYDLCIVDGDGRVAPPGTPGTLLVRGGSSAMGYWSRYDASRQVFQGEWLRTGDTYVQDADGYYLCLGRTDDVLKVSGMWVSPSEVEDRLLAHPAVAQAVVVAAPDADGLDKPIAFVMLRPGHELDEGALATFCRAGIESFKCPRMFVAVDQYPTTATGKIRRVELRGEAAKLLRMAEAPAVPAT